jgi:hypothetical protein
LNIKGTRRLSAVVIVGVLALIVIVASAYNISTSSKEYQFTSATLQGSSGVVFTLAGGGTLSLSNAYLRDNLNPTEMSAGGQIKVGYSFIGYPVSIDYVNSSS